MPTNRANRLKQIMLMPAKINIVLLLLVLTSILSCKSSQQKQSAVPATGMFKVEILYPGGEGKTFDMDYYEQKHMPMVAGMLGKNLRFYEIDKGIAGRTPNDKIPFVTVGYFYVYDVAEYNKAIAQNRDSIMADIKKYTNIQPTIQVSEVKAVGYPGGK